MMYFCPCPCNSAIDLELDPETEESTFLALPRNLSYVQESYLDRHSVSARFVHNPKADLAQQFEDKQLYHHLQHQQQQQHHHNDFGIDSEDFPPNEENDDDDEEKRKKAGLLNIVQSQQFPVCCSSPKSHHPFHLETCSAHQRQSSAPIPVTTSPQTRHKLHSPDGAALASPGTGSFMSRVAASRLASFLSPKEDRSPSPSPSASSSIILAADYDRDFSSSVDQPPPAELSSCSQTESFISSTATTFDAIAAPPTSSTKPSPHPATPSSQILFRSPDRQGLKMDRGEDVLAYPSHEDSVKIDIVSSPSNMVSWSSPSTSPSTEITTTPVGEEMQRGAEEDDHVVEYLMKDEAETSIPEDIKTTTMMMMTNTTTTDTDNGVEDQNPNPNLNPITSDILTTPVLLSGKTLYPGKEHSDSHPRQPLGSPSLTSTPLTIGKGQGQTTNCYESPDSDAFSEEGVFVNMTDDLDTTEKSTTVSEVSDDTCVSVDSMFLSPDEEELEEEKSNPNSNSNSNSNSKDKSEAPRMSVEEAISRAASDLSKMSMLMYPDMLDSPLSDTSKAGGNRDAKRRLARGSPVRQTKDLTIHLSYENINSHHTSNSKYDYEAPESPVYEEHEFNFSRKGLRKSSSLKTNKTPPGTPHRKKVVRFADAMGLDLESVRHVLNMESPPRIPPSAMADLKQGLGEDRKDVGPRFLCPCFTQPGASDGFVSKVLQQKISLENAIVTDLTITGFVRVANISYHKSVRVRYTHNSWATFHDIAASYVQNSCDGPTDRFSFSIVAPAYFVAGNRLEFAVSFNADGNEYWDSNGGANYAFECFAKSVPTDIESSWMHFL